MKRNKTLLTVIAVLCMFAFIYTSSCKTIARAAARYWTKKQIREFVNKCEDNTSLFLGSEKARKYCDCAVDVVAEKYRNYEDLKNTTLTDVLKIANDCK